MARTHETARKSTGPNGVPRHQLAPRDEGASSSQMPNPNDLSREELIAELERLQTDHKIVTKDKYQCNVTLGEYQEENEQLQRTITRLKTKIGRLHGEKGELQGELGHLQRQNEELGDQVGLMQVQLQDGAEMQQYMQEVLDVRTEQRDGAWALEDGYRNQIHTLQFRVEDMELWNDGLHEEVHYLHNLMDPNYQQMAVADDLGMVDNGEEDKDEDNESGAELEEDPEIVVPDDDDGVYDDINFEDDA